MKKLTSQLADTSYIISQVEESDLKHRLYEMGIYPNQTIEVLRKAPFGDPMIVQVDGHLVMLRLEEAELILIHEN